MPYRFPGGALNVKVRPQETLPTFLWRRNGDMVSPYFSLLLQYGYILLVTKIRKIPPQKKIKRYLHVGLKTQQNPKKQYICCLISMWIFQIHPNPPIFKAHHAQGTYDFVLILAALGQALGRLKNDPASFGALQILHLL